MSNMPVKKQEQFLTALDTPRQEILTSDIIVPKILLQQGLSEYVVERKAQQGDIVKSLTGEKIGDPDHPIEFIPLKMTNQWILQEEISGKYEFRGYEDRTARNENLEWDYVVNGTRWKRIKVINVFALLNKDIETYQKEMKKGMESGEVPDLSNTLTPVVISFRGTSFKAGRKVVNVYASIQAVQKTYPNIQSYHYTVKLGCFLDKNDKGSFYVFDILDKPTKTQPQYLEEAKTWYETFNQLKEIKIDESDLEQDEEAQNFNKAQNVQDRTLRKNGAHPDQF